MKTLLPADESRMRNGDQAFLHASAQDEHYC